MVLIPVQQLTEARRWQEAKEERSYWVSHLARDVDQWIEVVERYLRWMETLSMPPDSFLAALSPDAAEAAAARVCMWFRRWWRWRKEKSAPMDAILAWRGTPELRPDVAAWAESAGFRV